MKEREVKGKEQKGRGKGCCRRKRAFAFYLFMFVFCFLGSFVEIVILETGIIGVRTLYIRLSIYSAAKHGE